MMQQPPQPQTQGQSQPDPNRILYDAASPGLVPAQANPQRKPQFHPNSNIYTPTYQYRPTTTRLVIIQFFSKY